MFDSKLTELATTQIKLTFDERDQALAKDRRRIINRSSANGMLHSSRTMLALAEHYQSEIKVRSEQAFAILIRVMHHIGTEADTSLRENIAQFLEPIIRDQSTKVWSQMKRGAPFQNGKPLQLGTEKIEEEYRKIVESAVTKMHTEAELFATMHIRIADQERKETQSSVSIIGHQNIVVTGNVSRSTLSISIDQTTKKQVAAALDQIAAGLENTVDHDSLPKADIGEMVNDCRTELDKESPNQSKLVSLLLGIATAIQTSAAMKPAYDTLRGALSFFGISLP